MARKRFTTEQIIIKLREAEVELAKGQSPAEVCRKLGVAAQTYYRHSARPFTYPCHSGCVRLASLRGLLRSRAGTGERYWHGGCRWRIFKPVPNLNQRFLEESPREVTKANSYKECHDLDTELPD